MMKRLKIAILFETLLSAISSTTHGHGVSVSCMMAYDEGGAPAVFQSLECPQWVLNIETLQNQTGNCQFAVLQGHRDYQEDRVVCNLDMKLPFPGKYGPKEAKVGIFGVFDGHGGKEASEMASKNLMDYFLLHVVFGIYKQASTCKNEHDMFSHGKHETDNHISGFGGLPIIDDEPIHGILKEALLNTIRDIDTKFSLEAFNNNYASGSTATVVLLLDGEILVANVGDSKALLCSETMPSHQETDADGSKLSVEELTKDHHPDRDDERARVNAAGGFVHVWGVPRVNGILAVSRSIGDVYFKRYGVIAVPEVIGWRSLTTKDSHLVIASDGIFESLEPQNVCDLLVQEGYEESIDDAPCLSSDSLADCIVDTALRKGSMDNLSAVVIPLRQLSFHENLV